MSQGEKTVYVPYMSDHSYAIVAALVGCGIQAQAMAPPDEATLAGGLDACRGRECLPCFTTTGDILRLAGETDFAPERSQILMVTSCGPCRFGQYVGLQKDILAEQGITGLEFISPSYQNNYDGFGQRSTAVRKLLWQGAVAIDLLLKLLHAHRPYELAPGSADRLYARCLADVVAAVELGGSSLEKVMRKSAQRFEGLALDRRERRPLIGLVGEIYLRLNCFSNQEVIRRVEALGGEVYMAPLIEWLYFINWGAQQMTRAFNAHWSFFLAKVTDGYQRRWEHKLARPVAHLLPFPYETPIDEVLSYLEPYYEPLLGTEAVLTMGKAIELAHHGAAGILNVMPFTCMPGLIAAGMAPSFRPDSNDIPWLDINYEAQRSTNLNTRLEAFMFQAKQFKPLIDTPISAIM